MICSGKRKNLCIVLIVLNLSFIWINSLLPREVSAAFSKLVGMILEPFFPGPATPSEGEGQGILRKVAHFAEFCTLGMLLSWLAWMTRTRKWECFVIPLLCGAAAACVDETIQFFSPGRGPQLRDVGIDTLGVLLGVGIMASIALLRQKKQSLEVVTHDMP